LLVGGPEGGPRIPIPPASQLQDTAAVADPRRRRGLGFRGHGALAELNPRLSLLGACLPSQRGSECPAGDAEGRLAGPAVPPGQRDALLQVRASSDGVQISALPRLISASARRSSPR
jgi:hypothetical protein